MPSPPRRYHRCMAAVAQTAIAIRPLRASDIAAVRRIERSAYGSANPRTAFHNELRNGLAQYLVAEDVAEDTAARERQPPGVLGPLRRLGAHLGLGNVLASKELRGFTGVWFTHEQLHLVTIAVAPAHQGQGVAEALLLATCDLAVEAGLNSVALEVRRSNGRAIALYERLGFDHHGRLQRYYSDNAEDALVMLLDGLATAEGGAALARRRAAHSERYGDRFRTATG